MNPRFVHYAPLWCKSNYSFLEGASHPEELIDEAGRLGLRSLAITDRDGVYGAVRAHVAAQARDLHLVLGSEITLEDDSTLVLLAQDREGWRQLCQLLSIGRLRCEKGRSLVHWRELCEHAQGLLALWGGARSLLVREPDPVFIARDLREAFGDRLYAMVARHRRVEEPRQERRLRERAQRYGLWTVATHEVLYHTPTRRDLQDVLSCIRHGVTLRTAGRIIQPNAEHALKSAVRFSMLFGDDPQSLTRSEEVAARCSFSLNDIHYRYPDENLPDGRSVGEHLRHLTFEGARERYPAGPTPEMRAQLEKELTLVHELEYDGYFLTMWEIVQYCRQKEILCQGRGSAANSAVCYCLGITAIDPVRMGLLFERFLSRERAEPPDIDLDIQHERREEVIQHVYEKYGRDRAAMVANFIRYRARSAVREVGKVLSLPEVEVDRLANLLSYSEGVTPGLLQSAGFDPESPVHQHLLRLTLEIQDFPRHLSIHPGGFLLGHEPVRDLVPIENATMENRTVIQWDKEDLENLALFKVDLLGLGILTVVDKSLKLLREHEGIDLGMHSIPAEDTATYDMICKADTVGVFQIESRAQMNMLPRLLPRSYYDLVIEVSIVRPGPISGGMVHPYLKRRRGEEEVRYPHPLLEPILKKTLGVPIFQEQVMQLAMAVADYTPGEADQLRRDMAAWRQSGKLERHRDRLIGRMMAKGISMQFAEQVFEQIRGFGEYGFPESHAASFALIGYVTAWFKCHHPVVFGCALLNSQPMGFYAPATILDDLKRHDIELRPIDVQHSEWDCTLEDAASGDGGSSANGDTKPNADGDGRGKTDAFALRVGLRYIKGLREMTGRRIAQLRPFGSIEELAQRAGLERSLVEKLSEAGALAAFDENRRQALWKSSAMRLEPAPRLGQDAPEHAARFTPLTQFEEIEWDYRSAHHSVRGHPFGPMRGELRRQKLPTADEVAGIADGRRAHYVGLVINRQRPKTAGGVTFMTLEDETGFVNLVVWKDVFDAQAILARTASLLGVTGKIQSESGVVHLVVEKFWLPKLSLLPKPRKSRDFR